MKIYTVMPGSLKPFYKAELLLAKDEFKKKHYQQSLPAYFK